MTSETEDEDAEPIGPADPLLADATALAGQYRVFGTGHLQRHLDVPYVRAALILRQLIAAGTVTEDGTVNRPTPRHWWNR